MSDGRRKGVLSDGAKFRLLRDFLRNQARVMGGRLPFGQDWQAAYDYAMKLEDHNKP